MKNCKSYLWEDIPHQLLLDSGYITDFNKFRLLKFTSDDDNKKILDCGIDILIIEEKDNTLLYHGAQCKHYSKPVSGRHLGYFIPKIVMLQRKNINSNGYLFTSGNITIELKETLLSIGNIYHHKLPFNFKYNSKEISEFDSECESDNESEYELDYEEKYYDNNINEKDIELDELNLQRRDYQINICNKMIQQFKQLNKCNFVLNLTCSLGKTLIVGDVLKELQPNFIIVLLLLNVNLII